MNLAGDFSGTSLINSLGGRDNFDSRDWFPQEKTQILDFRSLLTKQEKCQKLDARLICDSEDK